MTRFARNSACLAVAGVLVLSACAPEGTAEEESGAETAESSPETEVAPELAEGDQSSETATVPSEGTDSEEDDGDAEGLESDDSIEEVRLDFIEELELGEPDSTLTYPTPGAPGGEITLDVYPVEVQDKVMRLALVFYPEYDGETLDYYELHNLETSGQDWRNQELAPQLIDRQHYVKYEVIRPHRSPGLEGHVQWAREVEGAEMTSGEPFVWWGFLPAPEDEIDVIDVELPQLDLPPFEDVEVIR